MSYKRQLPILVVIIVGFFTLLGFFINNPTVQEIANNSATQWFNIISGFALFHAFKNPFSALVPGFPPKSTPIHPNVP